MSDENENIADHIIANLDEKLEAVRAMEASNTMPEKDKQTLFVAGRGDRCARCGDNTFPIFPGGAPFCAKCWELFKELDYKAHGRFMWFIDMLRQIQSQQEGKANAKKG